MMSLLWILIVKLLFEWIDSKLFQINELHSFDLIVA